MGEGDGGLVAKGVEIWGNAPKFLFLPPPNIKQIGNTSSLLKSIQLLL